MKIEEILRSINNKDVEFIQRVVKEYERTFCLQILF